MYSFPVTVKDGHITVMEDLKNNSFIEERMKATEVELLEEKAAVQHLL
jgi:hypothetical protein